MTKCAVCVYGFDSETSTRGRCGVLATVELKDGNAFRYKDKRRKWEDSRIGFSAAVVTSKEDIKIMLHSRKYNQSRALAEKTTVFFTPTLRTTYYQGGTSVAQIVCIRQPWDPVFLAVLSSSSLTDGLDATTNERQRSRSLWTTLDTWSAMLPLTTIRPVPHPRGCTTKCGYQLA